MSQMSQDVQAPVTADKAYTCHLVIYSKLLQGYTPQEAIVKGVEAKIVGTSADCPDWVRRLCHPSGFFEFRPGITEIDSSTVEPGAFVYRPVYFEQQHASLFARIEARSEAGEGKPGRRFTHCAMIAVEQRWEPALIPWAAQQLFGGGKKGLGQPIYEQQEFKNALDLADPKRDLLPKVGRMSGSGLKHEDHRHTVHFKTPDLDYVTLGSDLAAYFIEAGLAVQGRWLPFGMGIGSTVKGADPGFFLRYDSREADAAGHPVKLAFSDQDPPRIDRPENGETGTINWLRTSTVNSGSRGVNKGLDLTPELFWPDQTVPEELFDAQPKRPHQSMDTQARRPGDASHLNVYDEEDIRVPPPDEASPTNFEYKQDEREREARAAIDRARPQINEPDLFGLLDDELENTQYLDAGHYERFSRERVLGIEAGFEQLIKKIGLMNEYFPQYQSYPTYDREICRAYFDTISLIATFSIRDDPKKLKPFLRELCAHEEVPVFGLDARSEGGVHAYILDYCCNVIDVARLSRWVDQKGRMERDLAREQARSGRVPKALQNCSPFANEMVDLFKWLNAPFRTDESAFDRTAGDHQAEFMQAFNTVLDDMLEEYIRRLDLDADPKPFLR